MAHGGVNVCAWGGGGPWAGAAGKREARGAVGGQVRETAWGWGLRPSEKAEFHGFTLLPITRLTHLCF